MLGMAHKASYLFLGRIHSPSQQILHKIFDIKSGQFLIAREVVPSRLTDATFKAYRTIFPDAIRDSDEAVLINVVKTRVSVLFLFRAGQADIDRFFGIRISSPKPVPEQIIFDFIAEVTNIMCFEQDKTALLIQETISLDTIPSTLSTTSEATPVDDEQKVLFALGVLSLCLMTITPFAEASRRIQHLILDLVEYEFTLKSSLYSDELVDLVSKMCILAGPCAPLDGLSVSFNEIVTMPNISQFIKDIGDYCAEEPEKTVPDTLDEAVHSLHSPEIAVSILEGNSGEEQSKQQSPSNNKVVSGSMSSSREQTCSLEYFSSYTDDCKQQMEHSTLDSQCVSKDSVGLLLKEDIQEDFTKDANTHPFQSPQPCETSVSANVDIDTCSDIHVEAEAKKSKAVQKSQIRSNGKSSGGAAPGDHVKTLYLYMNPLENCALQNREESFDEPLVLSSSDRKQFMSASVQTKQSRGSIGMVANKTVEYIDIVQTKSLTQTYAENKSAGRCKSLSRHEMQQEMQKSKMQDNTTGITLVARREYIKYC